MAIKRIGIIANTEKEKAAECALQLQNWAHGQGIEIMLEEGIARKIGESRGFDRGSLAAAVDLLVVMGETERF